MMGWRLRSLWRELMTPDDFEGRPYGGLTNSFGHKAGAAFVYIYLCAAYFNVAGELPYRWPLAAAVLAAYVVLVEIAAQGWRGSDSVQDSIFVCFGVVTVAICTVEVAFEGRIATIAVDMRSLLVCMTISAVAVLYYTLKRVIR